MGAPCLRQFLQSICQNSLWNYAVFWKLQHENQILLTWEDGCCGHLTLRESTESGLDEIYFNGSSEIFSSGWRQAVVSMAGGQYNWGEGVIGEVAYSGKHCWFLCDNVTAVGFEPKVVPEFPVEWMLQFAAGIKTIVLVPVIPHGVLQLGSLKKVDEDLALVAYVRDKFYAYQNGIDLPTFSSMEFLACRSSVLTPSFMDNFDDVSTTVVSQMKSEDSNTGNGTEPTNELSTVNQMTPVSMVPSASYISGNDIGDICNSIRESEISFQSTCLTEVSKPFHPEMMKGSIFGLSGLEEELQALSYSDNYDMGIFGEHANIMGSSYSNGSLTDRPIVDIETDNEEHKNVFHFPMDCELHKALGPTFQGQANGYLLDTHAHKDRNFFHGSEPSTWESSGWFSQEEDAGHLSGPGVDNIHGVLNGNLSNELVDANLCTSELVDATLSVTSLEKYLVSIEALGKFEENEFVEEKKIPCSSVPNVFGAGHRNFVTKSLPAPSLESVVCTSKQQQNIDCGHLQARKGLRVSNVSRRRARPGENPRPRPRDRQLIQDRVKELRELVPNGSKCSIDGLLDRTIKHMLFLRGIVDQADKLKQWVHEKVTVRENMKLSGSYDTHNGASWAFELGSDLQFCPIIVEDLEYPGHMLIEMLCSDHGLFLEIAEIIRHLGLTILKGVMESRTDNTWAHFVVEASKGFHRLDIFWPLLRLLQNRC